MDITQGQLRLADDVTFQAMGPGEQTVVLCMASGQLYTCNDTARSFLEAMDGAKGFDEIVDDLVDEYNVARQQLEVDLRKLADELLAERVIVTDSQE